MRKANKRSTEIERATILLVDDHPLMRQGLRAVLDQEHGWTVCGEAESAQDAMRLLDQSEPDVAVVDLLLKDGSGLDLIKDVKVRHPEVLILVLSMRDEKFYAERALRAGARGYVSKEGGARQVVEAIRKIRAGQIYVSEALAGKIMGKLFAGAATSPMDDLTDRELEVFELIGRGVATQEIAQKLHISPRTVDSHREHIKGKLGLHSAIDLVKSAVEWLQTQKYV